MTKKAVIPVAVASPYSWSWSSVSFSSEDSTLASLSAADLHEVQRSTKGGVMEIGTSSNLRGYPA